MQPVVTMETMQNLLRGIVAGPRNIQAETNLDLCYVTDESECYSQGLFIRAESLSPTCFSRRNIRTILHLSPASISQPNRPARQVP